MKRQRIRKLTLLVSFLFFPVTLYYFSPYLIIQGGLTGVVTGSLLAFAALFLFSLLFGRAFCGWVCPAGGLQEACFPVRDKRVTGRWADRVKYILWAPWLLGIVLSFLSAGGVKALDPLYMTENGISAADLQGYVTYYFIVGLILLLALLIGRRGMCHSVCWMAPFMIVGTRLKDRLGYPSLRLRAKPEACVSCGQCAGACPMSLPVSDMVKTGKMANPECILCASCADRCGRNVITLAFSKNPPNAAGRPDCSSARRENRLPS